MGLLLLLCAPSVSARFQPRYRWGEEHRLARAIVRADSTGGPVENVIGG